MSSYFEALNRRARAPATGAAAPEAPRPAPAAAPDAPAEAARPAPAAPARIPRLPAATPAPPAIAPALPPPDRSLAPVYATLRERLTLAAEGKPLKAIVFAGVDGHEGCTRVVHEFAESLAGSGLQVLLVDADLREARLTARLRASGPDLATLVRAQELPPAPERSSGSLTVVPGAGLSDQESLLRSPELASWLDGARERFHYTLLDSSPLLRHADGVLAGALCDGVVLVAKGGATPGASLARARQLVDRAGGRVVGVVLTDASSPIPSALRRFLERD